MFETEVGDETEDQVQEMMDKDTQGDGEEPAEKEEAPTEEEEAGEEDTEAPQEEETPLDWEKLDPRAKTEYEKAMKQATHWERTHAKLQSQHHQLSKSQKELEKTLQEYKVYGDELREWNQVLQQNPRVLQMVKEELARSQNPFAEEVPDHVKHDPIYQYVQKTVAPTIQALQQEISHLKGKASKIDEYETNTKQEKARAQLDSLLDEAKTEIKGIFGSDATEEQVNEVLQFMVDNNFYKSGKTAAMAVFKDQYENAIKTRFETEMKEKAKKFGTRTKSVNPSRATVKSDGPLDIDGALKKAFSEHGMDV